MLYSIFISAAIMPLNNNTCPHPRDSAVEHWFARSSTLISICVSSEGFHLIDGCVQTGEQSDRAADGLTERPMIDCDDCDDCDDTFAKSLITCDTAIDIMTKQSVLFHFYVGFYCILNFSFDRK